MQLTDGVYLVGSGAIRISNRYDCHTYLLVSQGEAALIDAGAGIEPERILANITAAGVPLKAVRRLLLTHTHGDHAGGVAALRDRLDLEVIASQAETDRLERGTDSELGLDLARAAGIYPADYHIPRVRADRIVSDGEQIQLGGCSVTALIRPGHSPGHTCYLAETGRRLLFGGDLVFLKGLASLLNVPGCEATQYRKSILSLQGLAVDALFPGHSLWCVEGAQEHLDMAVERWSGVLLPPNYG